MTNTTTQSALVSSAWEQQARAVVLMTDGTARYLAARAARSALQRYLFRQLRALTYAQVKRSAVMRLYEAMRVSRAEALAPLGMTSA